MRVTPFKSMARKIFWESSRICPAFSSGIGAGIMRERDCMPLEAPFAPRRYFSEKFSNSLSVTGISRAEVRTWSPYPNTEQFTSLGFSTPCSTRIRRS